MLVNVIFYIITGIFVAFCVSDTAAKYIGHHPGGKYISRLKAWLKRLLLDEHPRDDESHSVTRYKDQ